MRKLALLLAVLMAASTLSPALAASKKGKKAKAKPAATEETSFYKLNENGIRLMKDSIPLFLPTVLVPVYLEHQKQSQKADKKAK